MFCLDEAVLSSPKQMLKAPRASALRSLRWMHLELTHQLQDELQLEAPMALGTLFRSVWGLALHQRSDRAFELLFGPSQEIYRPWWWSPPDIGHDTRIAAGHQLVSRLSLQDMTWPHLGACLDAVADFGVLGLGPQRVRADLRQVRLLGPDGAGPLHQGGQAAQWDGLEVWQAALREAADWSPTTPMRVWARTPLRLKDHGLPLQQAPSLQTWVLRCMGRVQMLLPQGAGALLAPTDKQAWLAHCEGMTAQGVTLWQQQLSRYSARQQHTMQIDGLCGNWSYPARGRAAWPWLRLAEHLQLGGKTTLGFGVVQVLGAAPGGLG